MLSILRALPRGTSVPRHFCSAGTTPWVLAAQQPSHKVQKLAVGLASAVLFLHAIGCPDVSRGSWEKGTHHLDRGGSFESHQGREVMRRISWSPPCVPEKDECNTDLSSERGQDHRT